MSIFKCFTSLPKKEAEFKIGDFVTLDNNQTGEIIQVQLMTMSDTPVYKIKTKDGNHVWRYQEEIKEVI